MLAGALGERGFTLLEVLMSLTVFALIAGVCYTALGPAGEGFKQLQDVRDKSEEALWLGKQLRADIASVTTSSLKDLKVMDVTSDVRGDIHVDELTLLLREAGRSGLTLVHYKLDESKGELLRESRMAWARDYVEADAMILANKVSSFDVEVMDINHRWQQKLPAARNIKTDFVWPKALRVSISQDGKAKRWLMPLYQGID